MAQLGSNRITSAQSTNGVSDVSGVPLVSTFNDFGDSPLGIAARSQALYGIANAQFNLLPQNQDDEIVDFQNPLPYWSCENYSNGRIVPKSFYDTTTGTWSVELNPTAGSAADYLELRTRSFLLTDDNLALRQKAYLTMSKGTAYAGSTQFNVVLSAEYFDVNGASLSTYAIGTALDNTAMTSITGITTSGSAAISAAASYVDFTIKLTATATVTSGVKVYLKSFFVASSQAATGSFQVTERFTSSGTWTRPTGVNYVTVVAMGGGSGGQGGQLTSVNTTTSSAINGGAGGTTSNWAIVRDLYVGDVGSVVIGIGAGGAGGTARTFTKAAAATTQQAVIDGGSGADGGSTTFGSYLTVSKSVATSTFYGIGTVPGTANSGSAHALSAFVAGAPFTTFGTTGAAGGSATATGGANTTTAGGTANATIGIGGAGGQGGSSTSGSTRTVTAGQKGGAAGAGSGGGAVAIYINGASQTVSGTAGNGADAPTSTLGLGGGGGGGGAIAVAASSSANYNSASITIRSGAGSAGAAGFCTVSWIA
jgi:hypothetical protein